MKIRITMEKNSWDGILIQMSYKCKTKLRTVKEVKQIKNYIQKKNLMFLP